MKLSRRARALIALVIVVTSVVGIAVVAESVLFADSRLGGPGYVAQLVIAAILSVLCVAGGLIVAFLSWRAGSAVFNFFLEFFRKYDILRENGMGIVNSAIFTLKSFLR